MLCSSLNDSNPAYDVGAGQADVGALAPCEVQALRGGVRHAAVGVPKRMVTPCVLLCGVLDSMARSYVCGVFARFLAQEHAVALHDGMRRFEKDSLLCRPPSVPVAHERRALPELAVHIVDAPGSRAVATSSLSFLMRSLVSLITQSSPVCCPLITDGLDWIMGGYHSAVPYSTIDPVSATGIHVTLREYSQRLDEKRRWMDWSVRWREFLRYLGIPARSPVRPELTRPPVRTMKHRLRGGLGGVDAASVHLDPNSSRYLRMSSSFAFGSNC